MTVDIEGIGEVLVERSAKARRLSITVRPSRVRVAVPAGIPLSRGRDFAIEKKDWIRHHLERVEWLCRAHDQECGHIPPLPDIPSARRKIVERLEELSTIHALPYRGVSVRSQRTRWGSCSVHGRISLNINLARLPERLMDYVILHELLHTRIRGHGKEFWKALDALVGDARAMRGEIQRYAGILG